MQVFEMLNEHYFQQRRHNIDYVEYSACYVSAG